MEWGWGVVVISVTIFVAITEEYNLVVRTVLKQRHFIRTVCG